jgi:hypothetical protein
MQDVLEGRLYFLLYFPELLFVLERRKAKLVLLLLNLDILFRVEESSPAELAPFVFLFLRVFPGQIKLFLLKVGQDVGRRLDPKMQVLKGIDFDVFVGEELVDLFVEFGIAHFA